ncbi:MAG TPA: BamA/TamA family outer membrane protein [Gemmatimonadaceae bacterium]|nr:BamA/TamA family outer membrane protein [Gemmatimonadaceae bacterium]
MRSAKLALVAMLGGVAAAGAQQRDTVSDRTGLPRDVAREAARQFNDTAALRSTEPVEIADDRVVAGDVAVLNGPLVIGGRVHGRVVAINSDVVLKSTARVDGDLLVVGGQVEGRHAGFVGGEIRVYRQTLQYRQDGDRILPVSTATTMRDEGGWWRRWERSRQRNGSRIQIANAGAYNRIEGLPIKIGPQIFWNDSWGSARLDAYGVVRTETSFEPDQDDIGHNINAEVKLGRRGGLLLGGQLFNEVDPTATWQLSDLEAALSSFLFRRDYRDYYNRHGARAIAGGFVRRGAEVFLSYGFERWGVREAQNPFTLFHQRAGWRPNPLFDEGRMHLLGGSLRVDTRNDDNNPWSGWYVLADLENGRGDITAYGPRALPIGQPSPPRIQYTRGFLDFRRYNRVSPDAQLNFRVVAGGWLNGDPLPLQRRFAVDGPGSLPGYDFRALETAPLLTCVNDGFVSGMPGQCDRMLLGSMEYRGMLHLDLFTDWTEDHYMLSNLGGVWVAFVDAGRGWLVGPPTNAITFKSDALPPLSSFLADVGLGFELDAFGILDSFGVYVAKSISQPNESAHFFMRIRHRF